MKRKTTKEGDSFARPQQTQKKHAVSALPGLAGFAEWVDDGLRAKPVAAPVSPLDALNASKGAVILVGASEAMSASVATLAKLATMGGEHIALVHADRVDVNEVLMLGVEHFPKLPLASTVHAETRDGIPFVFTCSRAGYAEARARKEPAFVGGELLALALAAQHERMHAGSFAEAIRRKQKSAEWRVTPEYAIGPVTTLALSLTFADFFARFGVRMMRVEVNV